MDYIINWATIHSRTLLGLMGEEEEKERVDCIPRQDYNRSNGAFGRVKN